MKDPWLELLAAAREAHAMRPHQRLGWALEAFPEVPSLFDPPLPLPPPVPTVGLEENTLGAFRASDPDTSRQAAIGVLPRTGSQKVKIFEEAVQAGERGICTFEIVKRLNIAHQSASKRIGELHHNVMVISPSGRTRISPLGAKQEVYVVNELGLKIARERGLLPDFGHLRAV